MQPPQDDLSALPFLSVCPQCVLALPPDAKHCPRCGYRFEEQPEASEPGVDVPAAESGADAAPVETEEQPNIVASNPAVAPILGEPFEMPDFLATLQPGMFSSWREQAGALDQSAGETNPEPTQPHLQRATDLEPTQLRMQQAEAAPQSGIADAPTTPISPHIVQLPAGEGKAAEEKGEKTRTPDISRQQTRPTPRRQFIRFPAPAASARTQPGPNAAAASPVAPGALMSQGMGQQSNSAAAPVGTQSTLEHWLDIWWVRIPIVLRRYALMFSEAWCDGIYLTRYPRLACILPLLALLIGFIEGATHWTLSSIAGTIAFTELLPLMILTAIAGALSTNMGLMMIGGYMIGDFFIAAYQNPSYQVGAPGDFLNGVLFLRIPLLISYILLFSLAVVPTLITRLSMQNLRSLLKLKITNSAVLQICVAGIIQFALVYMWTLGAQLLIRVLWGWRDAALPTSAIYYLQVSGWLIAVVAMLAMSLRTWLNIQAYQDQHFMQRVRQLVARFKAVETWSLSGKPLPQTGGIVLTAGVTTLLISGIIANVLEGIIVFIFLAALLICSRIVLFRFKQWTAYARFMTRIPVLIRLAAGLCVSYIIVRPLLESTQYQPTLAATSSGSYQWMLIGLCLSCLIVAALLPGAPSELSAAKESPSTGQAAGQEEEPTHQMPTPPQNFGSPN